jgi:hypothetical protein
MNADGPTWDAYDELAFLWFSLIDVADGAQDYGQRG